MSGPVGLGNEYVAEDHQEASDGVMKIAVILPCSMRGTGFASKTTSMLTASIEASHEVHVIHFRFEDEVSLGSAIINGLEGGVTPR
jgi:hypothetical protein